MSETLLFLFGLGLTSIVIWVRVGRSADHNLHVPFFVYTGSYLVTTGIGAAIIAASDGDLAVLQAYGLDLKPLTFLGGPLYWVMLFAPLIIPGLVVLQFRRDYLTEQVLNVALPRNDNLDQITLMTVSFGFIGYCLVRLAMSGNISVISMWLTLQGDAAGIVGLRVDLIPVLGREFFGILYIALPTLSSASLYVFYHKPTLLSGAMVFLTVFSIIFLNLAIMQKSPLLIYFIILGFGFYELRRFRIWIAVIFVLSLICLLTVLQSFFTQDWTIVNSMELIIFRLASSFPYYLNLFPDLLPYTGPDLGLHLIGLCDSPLDHEEVYNYMYPQTTWAQGAAPAPAHVRAYAQLGPAFALLTVVICGFFIRAIATLRMRINGPSSFALYIASLLFLYYSTQTSLRESILSCYGIVWALISLSIPLLVSHLGEITRSRAMFSALERH
jgi:hypothetical protein